MADTDWYTLGQDYYHSRKEYTLKLNAKGTEINYNSEYATGFVNFFMIKVKDKFHVVRTITGAYEISTKIFDSIEEARKYMTEYVETHSY